ncbi:MAG TPA: methyl-accepting chemotaxis protein [Beijerinckiaceae bacterium]|jgi:methyl-accepting chemotaxis protein
MSLLSFSGAAARRLESVEQAQAVAEFTLDGRLRTANDAFLRVLGYAAAEIEGRSDAQFLIADAGDAVAHAAVWEGLRAGRATAQAFRRVGKSGRVVWLQGAYTPLVGRAGVLEGALFAGFDVTSQMARTLEAEDYVGLVKRAQAVIEFTPDGRILTANEQFLATFGYRLEEIVGQHHRIFVDAAYAASPDYAAFWRRLGEGEGAGGEFERVGKGGRKVILDGAYCPLRGLDGGVAKVLKIAVDMTSRLAAGRRLSEGLARLARGDLSDTIAEAFPPQLDGLRRDFNGAAEALRALVAQVTQTGRTISVAASEVAQASDSLSRRTEQQAASLEETAAALGEITQTVGRTAADTQRARDVAQTARTDAQTAGDVVAKTIESVGRIEQSSKQIAQIVGVIDEIAFQTNLLALNAGVEAARAGSAGAGFAVVASEVRALAQRSAQAAKEISALIGDSSAQVAEGVSLVGRTGAALNRILAQVGDLSEIVTRIAAMSQEQAAALQEVNVAVSHMDQITQENAAMVEQSSAASRSLEGEADELTRAVAAFKVVEEEARPRPALRRAS